MIIPYSKELFLLAPNIEYLYSSWPDSGEWRHRTFRGKITRIISIKDDGILLNIDWFYKTGTYYCTSEAIYSLETGKAFSGEIYGLYWDVPDDK